MIESVRQRLRRHPGWVKFQELNREGWLQAARRRSIQRAILDTPPIRTDSESPVEVRILTWRRDWINALWALKSFYHFAGVRFSLTIHDGGLERGQAEELRRHFPDARVFAKSEADAAAEQALSSRGWRRCLEYRKRNAAGSKIFDFFILSRASEVISLDSDVLFFDRPEELIRGGRTNLYNRDCQYGYSLSLEELAAAFGIKPVPYVNSGISRVHRESIDFAAIEDWLAEPRLFADRWVTEQTLHALCSARFGAELLPGSYLVSTEAGIPRGTVAKHYPGFFRPLLYSEGMTHLRNEIGFLRLLKEKR